MDAMDGTRRFALSQLWQFPLLVLSLLLFGVAAYLLIDRGAGLTIDEKINIARAYLRQDRPEAAIEQLNRLLDGERMDELHQAQIHLLLAASLEAGQKQRKIDIPLNHARIIEQTNRALELGAVPTADALRRLGDSYAALGRSSEAIGSWRKAMNLDGERSLGLQRKIIQLQIDGDDATAAAVSIEEYLRRPELSNSERAWALSEKAHLLIDRGSIMEARALLQEAMGLGGQDPIAAGQAHYWLGHCAWRLGERDQAERHLRTSREQLRGQHPLDADACHLLGKIYQDKGDLATAGSFYQAVVVNHPGSRVALPSRLWRGVCRIAIGQDDAGLADLHDVVNRLNQKDAARNRHMEEALSALRQAAAALEARQNFQGALEAMAYEQSLLGEPPAAFFGRLGRVFESRADQVEAGIDEGKPADRVRRMQQVRDLRVKAGDAYVAYSRALTLADDKGYGDAMWKGIEQYDAGGDLQRATAALELFVAERPEDRMAPDALLRLGQAYHAAGLFDKAISTHQRNLLRHPRSLAASKSAVLLALAYIAKGPEMYGRAEGVLRSVVENNPLLTPDAREFRDALLELGQLYYRMGRYEEALVRLEEFLQRYPQDGRTGQVLFHMADSYRKSAMALPTEEMAAAGSAGAVDVAEALKAKYDRLKRSRELYEKTVEHYRANPPVGELELLYQKLAHFYRADCAYELGDYAEAIRQYEAAAFRYQDDPSALGAYVQIVNANCQLGRMDEARAANERARWSLKRMPESAFKDGQFTMPRQYWEKWLAWSSQANLWEPAHE